MYQGDSWKTDDEIVENYSLLGDHSLYSFIRSSIFAQMFPFFNPFPLSICFLTIKMMCFLFIWPQPIWTNVFFVNPYSKSLNNNVVPWSNIDWHGLVGGLFKSCCMFEWKEHDTSSSSITIDLLFDGWKRFTLFLCNILFLCVSPIACFLREPMPLCPRARSLLVLHILHLNEVLSVPILSHILKSNSSLWSHSF